MHEILREPRRTLDAYDDRVAVGEVGIADPTRMGRYYAVLLTLRGTPFLYYGEEIGMTDGPVPSELATDPDGRDGCRTPLQWNGSPGSGFSTADPWLPIPATAATVNVVDQQNSSHKLASQRTPTAFTERPLDDIGLRLVVQTRPDRPPSTRSPPDPPQSPARMCS